MAWRADPDAEVDAASFWIGVDVGGVATHVAQRGVASILVNRMPQLGRWELGRPRAELRIADDLLSSLLARERAAGTARAAVGLAAPAWFGVGERTRLADVVDPGRRHHLVATTTTLAVVAGVAPELDGPVLAIDAGLGFSASIVVATSAGMFELGAAGVAPHHRRGVAATTAPDTPHRDRVVRSLIEEVRRLGPWSSSTVLIVDAPDGRTVDELQAVIESTGWHVDGVEALNGRSVVAKGAAVVAEAALLGAVHGSVHPSRPRDEHTTMLLDPPQSGGGWSWALPRSVGVLAEDAEPAPSAAPGAPSGSSRGSGGHDTGMVASVHTVVERGTAVPVDVVQGFDLGPDDGTSVFLDIYEPDDVGVGHRLVATATWAAGASHPADAEVAFVVDVDGRFRLEPAADWHLEWHEHEVVVRAVRPGHVDTGRAAGPERASARSLPRPATRAEAAVDVAPPTAPQVVAVAVRRAPVEPILPVAAALVRCERLLSFEVGELIGLRSAFALLGCADDPAEVETAAARLDHAVAGRDDELARAIRAAIDAVLAEHDRGTEAWYFGGTAAEVADELARVVEHLAVVVGEVSIAEQRRLERDALLLGLAPDAARRLVEELVRDARVARPVSSGTAPARAAGRCDARFDPELGCFVLERDDTDEPSPSTSTPAPHRARTVRMRVVIDLA